MIDSRQNAALVRLRAQRTHAVL